MNQGGPSREAPQGAQGGSRTPVGESVETALQLAIDLHGPGLLSRPDKLKLHLEAQCPTAGSDIAFLMLALDEAIPQALLQVKSTEQLQGVVARAQETLAERRGLNPFAATWTVATWAAALRMDLFGQAALPGVGRRGDAVPSRDARPLDAARPSPVEPRTGPPTVVPAAPFSVPFGHLAKAAPVAATTPSPVRIVPEVVVPAAEPLAPAAVDAPVDDVRHADESQQDVPETSTAHIPITPVPLPSVRGAADDASPSPLAPPASGRPVGDDDLLPRWAAGAGAVSPQLPIRPRVHAKWAIAGLLAAIVVVVAAMRAIAPTDDAPMAPPTGDAPASPPVASPVPAAPPPPAPQEPVAATPTAPSILDVVADGSLLGDGAKHAVFVTIDPARSDVRSVEATLMSGDGPAEPRSRVVEVKPDAIRDGRIAVGDIGLRTTRPATATYQYVLTTADGERSTPFVKQFAFAPVAPRASAIGDIVVPPGIVAGSPFTLTIRFEPGESGLAAVERATVGAAGPPRRTLLAGLASPSPGTLRYPVEPIASAGRTTLAFTLVDRDGSRSDAKRIVVEPAIAKRAVVEGPRPVPARPEAFACTRTTCGSVVAVREIERSKTYEVIARMDDRTIRTVVASTTWKVGTRVRRAGNGFAPVAAVAAVVAPARPTPANRAPVPVLPESPPIVDR